MKKRLLAILLAAACLLTVFSVLAEDAGTTQIEGTLKNKIKLKKSYPDNSVIEGVSSTTGLPSSEEVYTPIMMVVDGTPESGATTHPGVLSGCIEYFRAHGVSDISVIEGSWVGDETMRAMRRAGYDKVCQRYGVPFYDLKKDQTHPVKTAIGNIDICCRALDAGLLVDLPVLKGDRKSVV